jgi:hypothetical protein
VVVLTTNLFTPIVLAEQRKEQVMQVWRRIGEAIVVGTREPHVYSTEHGLYEFLCQYLAKEKSEHWLVFTGAEEKMLNERAALKSHCGGWPEVYLDNMVLGLVRMDMQAGMNLLSCRVHSNPPDVINVPPEHLAIWCNPPSQ